MAQLIKLQDYISRYEQDIYRYSNQYIRFKKQQWENFQDRKNVIEEDELPFSLMEEEDSNNKLLDFLKNGFKRKKQNEEEEFNVKTYERNGEEDDLHEYFKKANSLNLSKEGEKQYFLDGLYPYQLKWASSTIRDKSFLDVRYKKDKRLKYLLQRFPDTFLVMYNPIFLVKQAPVQLEIILVTPGEIKCINMTDVKDESVLIGKNDRFWQLRDGESEKKIVNPAISLNRMGNIVKNILIASDVTFPIHKLILSENSYIDFPDKQSDIEIYDKRNYDSWFQQMRGFSLPIKHSQLKAAATLLEQCQSSYVERPEWK
ncbi:MULTISPECIES: NERD domain-containing protein [Bacillus]|uniref:NERD domain-containing protein n=1 Tax=Bacillus TaxID=1386 RepID=UPI000BB9A5E4|nr:MULTISPECIES: NERD domain-containing protein [Bacillus]